MAMTIKDKNEVGAYIDFLLNERQWKQADLSKKLTEIEGRPVSRDNVCKWIAGERYPGIDHIYYLAQVLTIDHSPCMQLRKVGIRNDWNS